MAEIAHTVENQKGNVRIVTWDTVTNGDTTTYYTADDLVDVSIHAYGTWGTSDTLNVQGTNETAASPTAPISLKDTGDTTIAFSSNNAAQVVANMVKYRPNLATGDANTSLTVIMKFVGASGDWRKRE